MADSAYTFNLAESLNAGANLAKNKASLQAYYDKQKSDQAIRETRQEAATGDNKAVQALMALDPQGANQIIAGLSTMDKNQREHIKQQSEETAKQVLWVEQGESPEAKSARWNQVVDYMVKSGNKDAEKYRGRYSPQLSQQFIMKAMTIDDINEQFSFGQLKAGMVDGKPAYFMSNKAGQTKVLKGVTPPDKDIYGSQKSGDKFKFKASDANSIRASAAGLFGGTWSPETGRILGVQKDTENKVLAISERAAKLYRESQGGISHDEATAQAARELGIKIPQIKAKGIKAYLDEQLKNPG